MAHGFYVYPTKLTIAKENQGERGCGQDGFSLYPTKLTIAKENRGERGCRRATSTYTLSGRIAKENRGERGCERAASTYTLPSGRIAKENRGERGCGRDDFVTGKANAAGNTLAVLSRRLTQPAAKATTHSPRASFSLADPQKNGAETRSAPMTAYPLRWTPHKRRRPSRMAVSAI